MRYQVILLSAILLLPAKVSDAQYYNTGQDPASLKWMQIKTDRGTVIYPKSYGSEGIAFAQSLDEAHSKLVSLYPEKKYKIPVVIHNLTTQSNGYVAWAPRRMEIYPTPGQNTIPLDPQEQLSIHELTHVLQMKSLNRGFSKAMSLFLGEQYTGVVASLLPLWFFEGEAVFAESALTESGRGRSPSFQKQLKAITVEKGSMYKYDKIVNGSYRDYVPDHYQSGYQMVTWALAKYDPEIWNRVLDFTAEQPFTINPVNISLSRSAGLTKKTLFKETFDTLNAVWTKDVSDNNATSYKPLNPDKQGKYINYYSPVYAGPDSLIAIKTSLTSPLFFVLINPSERSGEKIHTPGRLYSRFISYAKGKLVWVESQSDPRWANRNYSIIKLLDLHQNRITRLSRKSRYLAASVSPDATKVAAIENTINNKNNIVFIDAVTGTVTQSVPSPGNAYLQRPLWSEEGEKIAVVFLTKAGEGIMSYTLASQQWEILIEAGREDLRSSFLRNDSLFFISSLSGTDNIYLRTPDKEITPLTRSRFGTDDLMLNEERVYFSDYTSFGNNICNITLAEASVTVNKNTPSTSLLIDRFDIKPASYDVSAGNGYTPEPYRKWQHLFKFHSWMPFYADIEEIKVDPSAIRPGLTVMSQNHLSTLTSSIGYEYSPEKDHLLHSRVTWEGWYPVFESELDYGNKPIIYKTGSVGDPSEIYHGLRFSNAVSIPLHFSSGKFSQYLRPSFNTDYSNNYIYIEEEDSYDYGQTIVSGRLYFSNFYRFALRDIYPRWAQTIDLNYSFAPFDKDIYGSVITFRSSFYFPGFLPNNGIKLRLEKEKQDLEKFFFANKIPLPRGYKNVKTLDIEFLSVDYVLPLAYPDFNIASLLYLKRIRTGLFYDYALGTGNTYYRNTVNGLVIDYYNDYQETFKSFGFELMADFHLFRVPFMLSCGVQTAWKKVSEMPSFELLFNIDIFGMILGRDRM